MVGKLKVTCTDDGRFATVQKKGFLVDVAIREFSVDSPRGEDNALELARRWAAENQDKG